MDFEAPASLLLLPFAAMAVWAWSRRRRSAFRYSCVGGFADLPAGSARRAEFLSVALRAAVLVLSIFALAGPRIPDRTTRLPADGIAIAFACDVSGSMGEPDFIGDARPTTRLDAARRAFALFVEGGTATDGSTFAGRQNDSIALVTFAAWPRSECPLTLNHSVLLGILSRLEAKGAGLDSGTNIGDAIAEALIRLKPAGDRRRVLIVLSDGEHNATGTGADAPFTPRQAAQLAANLGIPIYAIDCGGDPKPDAPDDARRQREAGRAALESIAATTGGRAFTARDGAALREVYHAIDQLERAPTLSFQYRRHHRFAPALLAAALVGLATLVVAERFVWRRLP
jgi:Ca-activated chloride channel homolog